MKLLSILILLLSSTFCFGQESESLWNWTDRQPHHQSVVKILPSDGGMGTGVIIHIGPESEGGYEGVCLTAYHVVEARGDIKVGYANGKRAKKCKVLAVDETNDTATLRVWVPKGIPAAKLAEDGLLGGGEVLEVAGLGGGVPLKDLRHFETKTSTPTNENKIFADAPLLPGDSGGPVFNQKHEVVGIISGGWFWFQSNETQRVTWPTRASNVGPIRSLLSGEKTCCGLARN